VNETVHWAVIIFGFGGLFLLLASRPSQTASLANTAVTTLGGVVNVEKGFVSGAAPA
jgi:hypothetical protein